MDARHQEELLCSQVANNEAVVIRDASYTITISCEADVFHKILVMAMLVELLLAL